MQQRKRLPASPRLSCCDNYYSHSAFFLTAPLEYFMSMKRVTKMTEMKFVVKMINIKTVVKMRIMKVVLETMTRADFENTTGSQ